MDIYLLHSVFIITVNYDIDNLDTVSFEFDGGKFRTVTK